MYDLYMQPASSLSNEDDIACMLKKVLDQQKQVMTMINKVQEDQKLLQETCNKISNYCKKSEKVNCIEQYKVGLSCEQLRVLSIPYFWF